VIFFWPFSSIKKGECPLGVPADEDTIILIRPRRGGCHTVLAVDEFSLGFAGARDALCHRCNEHIYISKPKRCAENGCSHIV
jgi:hypothetical protein